MIPAWHDKPTEPGEWLLVNRRLFRRHTADISSISSWRIDAGDRYYGPIPQDKRGVGE